MSEDQLGAIVCAVGAVLFLSGWALDRSDLTTRFPLRRQSARANVSTIATIAGAAALLVGLSVISFDYEVSF
jgi:hypothetical protein